MLKQLIEKTIHATQARTGSNHGTHLVGHAALRSVEHRARECAQSHIRCTRTNHMQIHTCAQTCTYMHIYMLRITCTCTYIYTCTCTYMHMHMHTCQHADAHMQIHMHISAQAQAQHMRMHTHAHARAPRWTCCRRARRARVCLSHTSYPKPLASSVRARLCMCMCMCEEAKRMHGVCAPVRVHVCMC